MFSGIERYFALKHNNEYNAVVFLGIYLFFVLCGVVVCILEKAVFGVIIFTLIALLSIILAKEVRVLQSENGLFSFQKNVISNSYDASSSAFFIFADTGKLIFCNKLAVDLFQNANIRTIDDFILVFNNYNKIMPLIKNLQTTVECGKACHVDTPIVLDVNGSAYWRISAAPVEGFRGYTVWSITDVTMSCESSDLLESNSTFLLDIVNSSTEAFFSLNETGSFIFCNTSFAKMLGTSIAYIVDKDLKDFIVRHGSDPFPVANGSNKLMQSVPSRIIFKNQETGNSYELMIKQIFISDDARIRTYSAVQNNTIDKNLVDALGQTKLYFENIFEDAPVGIVITDGAEILDACNRTFKELTEYAQHQSFLDFVTDECRESVKSKLYDLLNAVYSSDKPIEVQLKNPKNIKTVTVYAKKLDRDDQKQNGLILYFVDISERKELQKQFVQSQKMQAVGQLAGGIAHDFNNLLTAMIGYCDLLLAKFKPTDQSFSDIMQIKQNANRASNLVRQLLAFSRQQAMQPKVLSVTDMLVDLSVLLARLLGAKVELSVTHGKDIGCIKVDQVHFEQVIINLAVNARDAMPNGGKLTIHTTNQRIDKQKFMRGEMIPEGHYVAIAIEDTGCGIPEGILGRIFDPFFSTKEKGNGTGLGLSTVYGIVKQTGGFIDIESTVGKGTTFTLYFPICKCDITPKPKPTYQETQIQVDTTGNGKILLVEDEEAVRMFGARALRDKGYTVVEASNGESALDFIKNDGQSIDLMITDVVMPKMDGPTLINYVKEFAPDMKVMFISGYTEDSFRESLATNAQHVHFLPKPFNLKELALKVKEVISQKPTS